MNVEMPDGRVVAFPPSMSQAEVEAALKGAPTVAAAAPPSATALPAAIRWPLGVAAAGASDLANTLALPGAAAELAGSGINWLAGQTLPAGITNFLSDVGKGTGFADLITPSQMTTQTNKAGLSNNPLLAPQSELERLAQAAAGGVGSVLPLLPLGAAAPLLASGAGAGLASEIARTVGAPKAAQIAAGAVAGLGVQGITSALARGIPHIAADLGTSATLQEAGEALQDSARSWLTKVPRGETPIPGTLQAKLADVWAPVDEVVPKDLPVGLDNYRVALGAITTRSGALSSSEKALRPPLPEKLKELLDGAPPAASIPPIPRMGRTAGPAGVINPPAGPATPIASGRMIAAPAAAPTWSDLAQFRSTLGDAMADPMTVKAAGAQNLSHLYAAVTADMRAAATTVGPEAAAAFDNANAVSSHLYGIAQGPVANMISGAKASVADDPRPGDVASRLLSGARKGGTDLAAIRSEMPEAVDELAAAHLRLHPDGKAWKLFAPEGQEALVTNPVDRAIIANTYTPKIPAKDQIDRSILGTLIGESIGKASGSLFPGLPGETLGAVGGAALPYVVQGGRQALRNPLLGVAGGIAGNPLQP